ncbi:MAG: phosphate signaling complex protein PhoU [Oscillospiraceae bacterium]|nr:phosphate signaling complex protein PhoU [Oscillospiraceae bacterium]
MRNRFDEQLELLNIELIKMGALCEDGISASAKALLEGDEFLRNKAIETEREIDQKEKEIEQLCVKLLLQQQPVAKDLRLITSALKMIADMERIGDQAADIAEITPFVDKNVVQSKSHINDMARATIKMVTDSIESFVKKDLDLARSVMKYDDIVDNLFNRVKSEIIELISADPKNGEFGVDLMMIAKYFERIGDHAVNIAEWVEYSLTGKHVGEE